MTAVPRNDPCATPAPEPALVAELRRLRAAGASFGAIAAAMNRRGLRGRMGGRWFPATVRLYLLPAAPPPQNSIQSNQGVCNARPDATSIVAGVFADRTRLP